MVSFMTSIIIVVDDGRPCQTQQAHLTCIGLCSLAFQGIILPFKHIMSQSKLYIYIICNLSLENIYTYALKQ